MNCHLKVTRALAGRIQESVRRPHRFAAERVGFLVCRPGVGKEGLVILAQEFHAVADEDYERDRTVGARVSERAIRRAMETAYRNPASVFFVHEHEHDGLPWPSRTDLECWDRLCPNFWHVCPGFPHGGLILSRDSAMALVWVRPGDSPVHAKVSLVGWPMKMSYPREVDHVEQRQ